MSRTNDRNSGSNTEACNTDGTFAPGNPRGSRHRSTQAFEAMLEGQKEALTQAAIDQRLEGRVTSLQRGLVGLRQRAGAQARRHAGTQARNGRWRRRDCPEDSS